MDIIASVEGRLVPFVVKYRAQATGAGDLKGLEQFCADRKADRGYVITKDVNDFSIMPLVRAAAGAGVARIPAPTAATSALSSAAGALLAPDSAPPGALPRPTSILQPKRAAGCA